ncbi:endoribonuclease Dicer [Asimina triloba]
MAECSSSGSQQSISAVDHPVKDPRTIARKYQLMLCQKAVEENVIVYLGTGCGKTHIAVLLIYELGHLIRKPQKEVCVFLAPTVHLVRQSADCKGAKCLLLAVEIGLRHFGFESGCLQLKALGCPVGMAFGLCFGGCLVGMAFGLDALIHLRAYDIDAFWVLAVNAISLPAALLQFCILETPICSCCHDSGF